MMWVLNKIRQMEIPVVMTSTYNPDGGNVPLYNQGQKGILIHVDMNTYKSALCAIILDDGRLIITKNHSFKVTDIVSKN